MNHTTHRSFPLCRFSSVTRLMFGTLFIAGLLFLNAGCTEKNPQESAKEKRTSAPSPVKITVAALQDVPVERLAVGTVEPFASVAIKSQVEGILETVAISEGDQVKAGDLLFRIDPRPYRSRLSQAEATLAKDRAALDNARKQAERYQPAAEKGYVSAEQSDQAQTSAATLQAQVIADEAAVESARIDLDNCTIRSPISGYTGELLADAGNLVKAAADQPLVSINQTSPIKVSFTLPEHELPAINRFLATESMDVSIDAANNPLVGKLSFIDNRIDPTSGTIRLKATVANNPRVLWPGQFVNVRLQLTTRKDAVVVPSRAVQPSQGGDYVYLVDTKTWQVKQQSVIVAFSSGELSVIDSGLQAGETVVTDGQLRLRDGATVKPIDETSGSATNEARQ